MFENVNKGSCKLLLNRNLSFYIHATVSHKSDCARQWHAMTVKQKCINQNCNYAEML